MPSTVVTRSDPLVRLPATPGGPDPVARLTASLQELLRQSGQQDAAARVEIGRMLAEVRALLAHGAWLAWLDREVSFTSRSAESYIQLYEWARDHPVFYQRLSLLGISKLYLLSRLDTRLVATLSSRSAYVVPSSGKSRTLELMTLGELMEVVAGLDHARPVPEPGERLVATHRRRVNALVRSIDALIAHHELVSHDDLEELHDHLLDAAARLAARFSLDDD